MNGTVSSIVTVVTAIIGLAILAVLVSRQAQTGTVILDAAKGLAGDISAAVSPISSGGFNGGFGLSDPFSPA